MAIPPGSDLERSRTLPETEGSAHEGSPQEGSADGDSAQEPSSARLHLIVGGLVLFAVLAAGLIAAFATKSSSPLRPGRPVPGEDRTIALLTGVPQRGYALGSPKAPVTLIEYADLRCGSCATFSNDVLPSLVRTYVDSGELRIVFRPLDTNGNDSVAAARIAVALARQNVMWQFTSLVYRNQQKGAFVTETYIAAIIATIGGANLAEALVEREKPAVAADVARFAAQARRLHLTSQPAFMLYQTGGRAQAFEPSSVVNSAAFGETIESLLPKR